jgi:hypothetical protein
MSEEIDFEVEAATLKAQYEAGDRRALWQAIVFFAAHHPQMWDWLAAEIVAVDLLAEDGKLATWNDVFGQDPWRLWDGQQRGKQTFGRRWEVYNCVRSRWASGEAIGDRLFEEIGVHLGLSKTTVSNLYYCVKDRLPEASERVIEQDRRDEDWEAAHAAAVYENDLEADPAAQRRLMIRTIAGWFPHTSMNHIRVVEREFFDPEWVEAQARARNGMSFDELLWRRTRFLAGYR